MARSKILIVDDDPDIVEFIRYNLSKDGYELHSADNGKDALKLASEIVPDLIILDIMMPELDGVETCHQLRSFPALQETVIAFLTARSEEYSEIAGLKAGADDYIQKPISPRLLLARVQSLLRRKVNYKEQEEAEIIQVGSFSINKERYEVSFGDQHLELPKKEFDILCLLASKPGKVFTREEIYYKIWGDEVIVGNRTIDVHVSKLREKLESNTIRTIKGIGYKLEL